MDEPAPQTLTLDTSEYRARVAEADRLAKGLSTSLSAAFVGVAAKGKSLGDVVRDIGLRLSQLALSSALKPLEQGLSGLLSGSGGGLGSIFSGLGGGGVGGAVGEPMNILPFAKGGVLASPAYFPLAGGMGVAGERGAEAILPLARGPDGGLGVRAAGGGGGTAVTVNITTPDVEGFRRSEAEVAAALARMVGRGSRGM